VIRALALLSLLAAAAVLAEPPPTVFMRVNDVAGILTDDEEVALSSDVKMVQLANKVELSVLTVRTTGTQDIELYSRDAANRWGGGSRDSRGVLLVLAVEDRRSRLEVGVGLEKQLTQQISVTILDGMKPALKEKRYKDALSGAVQQVGKVLSGRAAELYPGDAPGAGTTGSSSKKSPFMAILVGIGFVIVMIVGAIFGKKGGRSGQTYGNRGFSSARSFSSPSRSSSSSSSSRGSFRGGGASSSW
jgi:uncharacterized protein